MATYTVSNLQDSGAGSLRAAILAANASASSDTIVFSTGLEGTISLNSALPAITDRVAIQALAAGQSTPSLQIDFAGHAGLTFAEGSGGSSLIGLSLVKASGAALTLISDNNTIQDNYIGVDLDGQSALGNQGNGITITATSTGNLIGSTTPADSTSWNAIINVENSTYAVGSVQGIRSSTTAGDYILCGTGTQSGNNQTIGLVYVGDANGQDNTWATVNAENAFNSQNSTTYGNSITSCYGPEQIDANTIRVVGSFNVDHNAADISGFVYTGKIDAADDTTNGFAFYKHPKSTWTFLHSTEEGLVVGNWDTTVAPDTSVPIIGAGKAFIYDVDSGTAIADIKYPGSKSTTAYGIAKVNDNLFAITGSYSLSGEGNNTGHGYLVYYHRDSQSFSEWTSWDIDDANLGNIVSHADGISYNSTDNTFTLATVALEVANGTPPVGGYLMTVQRDADGGFGTMRWTEVSYNDNTSGITIPTSVAGDVMTGEYAAGGTTTSWSSETSFAIDPSNVISGNGGNGIAILDSTKAAGTNNTIAQNRIGTSADGTAALANGENGILIDGSSRNLIGGTLSGGNDPTKEQTVPPPLGNLISGNSGHGVLITDGATHNTLSGNFIGTSASGNQKLGNDGDGVAIIKADNNALLGCQLESSPFVYYNVVSGNTGNGLRISNSDNTTIHANFFGLAANNVDPLGNGLNGALIEGDSSNTQYGGVIPLGNVNAGNGANGIEVKDTANGFITFNTFAGTTAFGSIAPNEQNGMLFTSTGGNNTIRTNVIGGNRTNGIHITGDATGIVIDPNIIGLDSYGLSPTDPTTGASFANLGHGILIDGNSNDIQIIGEYQSVIPQNTISNNQGYGLYIGGKASNIVVEDSVFGVGSTKTGQFGNQRGGIYIGGNSQKVTIGDSDSSGIDVLIAYNHGSGITINGRLGNTIVNTELRDNSAYGISFLSMSEEQAFAQIGDDVLYLGNDFGAINVVQGWSNSLLSMALDGLELNLLAAAGVEVLRQDRSAARMSFGFTNTDGDTVMLLENSGPRELFSLTQTKIMEDTWELSEHVAIGSQATKTVEAGSWTPIAINSQGQQFAATTIALLGNAATVQFSNGSTAVFSVPGTGQLSLPEIEGDTMEVTATVHRLGRLANALAFYATSDEVTGAIGEVKPGDDNYFATALASAKESGLYLQARDLPEFKGSKTISLTMRKETNYGILVINEQGTFSSYNAANPSQSEQFTSFTSAEGGLTYGIEDLWTGASASSDHDFNDLIIQLPPTA